MLMTNGQKSVVTGGVALKRLAKFDVSRRFAKPSARSLVQVLFGLACAFTMVVLRSLLDFWVPTAGPFALVYPTVLIATLYGHWRGGLAAWAASFVWAWYFVLPVSGSFEFIVATDPSRVAINAFASLVVVIFAEAFRMAVEAAMVERDREIERRIVLMQELEHRTKNNFALAASLLDLQKRHDASPELSAALDQAVARIRSFAYAYENVAESQGEGATVSMRTYLSEVVQGAVATTFSDRIEVSLECTACDLPREAAVAIGLFTNEVLTNCAKHAFPDNRAGNVDVHFHCEGDSWTLSIIDDGNGIGAETSDVSGSGGVPGLGTKLLHAFAQQARANYVQEYSGKGCIVRLESE